MIKGIVFIIYLYDDILEKYKNNIFGIPTTFNNPFKACFSNKKYIIIQTHPTQIVKVYFLMKQKSFYHIFKDHWCSNFINITFFRLRVIGYQRLDILPPHT